ncbi:TPA: hypothetical protein DDW69_04020 [candidate division CPR2 bacterium]|uniref:Serine hydrolase family protein n=1 Tax=candidate division CPR2 bacterium GW2011_GWC1_41_48 TaxID=1618344 RepID=A0A0G0WA62_UNCC2|nr:MAG: hypothetical protein UT47_C0003G0008 [candidate division CPR2 bacterium GW2011_GWC2_39_35]KKR27408.1 MAG: hypothetical protein UT60_C0050G0007 [candidate division CPR2 bacterium GW2011_GWD2_39_7]KKS08947.1 MAG: hypothetical protein UU65_C0003G0002 [candidate division CPR2 bacterium GW2011_GWC1_41_48]HBG81976.1 hypothetical protein [candidate division CPR2 bacterium]HCL99851.1 hypothetical protein [candidate division CPR2 bacterium]
MKVILMHGKDTNPNGKWYPWFAGEMKDRSIPAIIPLLPKADNPHIEEWMKELEKAKPDEDTIILGHSRGGVAVLRWLEKLPEDKRVKKVILLATNSGFIKKMPIKSEPNHGFYTENGYDFKEIKKHCRNFVVMHSRDDHLVPFASGKENAKALGAKFLVFEDLRHFGGGVEEITELLEEIDNSVI